MKPLIKIAAIICLLGTCQVGFAPTPIVGNALHGSSYDGHCPSSSSSATTTTASTSASATTSASSASPTTLSQQTSEVFNRAMPSSSVSTETAQSTTAQPAETVSVNKQQLAEVLAWAKQHGQTEAPWMNYGDYHSTTSSSSSSTPQTTSSGTQKIAAITNNTEKPLTVKVIMVKDETPVVKASHLDAYYPTNAPSLTYGDYHSSTSTSTDSTPQTASSGTQKIVVYVAKNNDLRDVIRKQDLVSSGSFHAMTSDVAMMVPIEPTMSWETPELLAAKAQAARLKQNVVATTSSTSSAPTPAITSFFLPFRSNDLNNSYATFNLGFSYSQPFGERQRRQGSITSGTAQSTITQPTESTPVSSSANSSSSSAWTSEDEAIYGPQTASTLTQEAQALFSSTLPVVAALAMTAMAMQTKSAH